MFPLQTLARKELNWPQCLCVSHFYGFFPAMHLFTINDVCPSPLEDVDVILQTFQFKSNRSNGFSSQCLKQLTHWGRTGDICIRVTSTTGLTLTLTHMSTLLGNSIQNTIAFVKMKCPKTVACQTQTWIILFSPRYANEWLYLGILCYDRQEVTNRLHSYHQSDVIMGATASQITSLTIVYSTVYSDADQRKHQSSASLAFVRGIHRRPVHSPHKGPVTRKMFRVDDVIM